MIIKTIIFVVIILAFVIVGVTQVTVGFIRANNSTLYTDSIHNIKTFNQTEATENLADNISKSITQTTVTGTDVFATPGGAFGATLSLLAQSPQIVMGYFIAVGSFIGFPWWFTMAIIVTITILIALGLVRMLTKGPV